MRKDDIGGRFPGSRLERFREAFPEIDSSGRRTQTLAAHSCGDSRSFELRSLLTPKSTACPNDRSSPERLQEYARIPSSNREGPSAAASRTCADREERR